MIITGKKFSKPKLSRVINGDDVLKQEEAAPEKYRLDHLLVQKYPEYNRSSLQKFIREGFVLVDGEVAEKANAKYLAEVEIELRLPKEREIPPRPPVIYEDEHTLVLEKPAGMLSMAKGEYCAEATLEDFGMIAHRLDRGTSGVVILAKDAETQRMLRRQFQERKAHKTYYAIVEGHPKLDAALIDLPIARNLKHPTTFLVDQNGKASQTYYEVVEQTEHYSLLKLKPTTGRTHQLRVHLKYLGTPIAGDAVYNPGSKAPRLMLHAAELEISVPGVALDVAVGAGSESAGRIAKVRKTFVSEIPKEFMDFLRSDEQASKRGDAGRTSRRG